MAFFLVTPKTSVGQMSTHIPQPLHLMSSITGGMGLPFHNSIEIGGSVALQHDDLRHVHCILAAGKRGRQGLSRSTSSRIGSRINGTRSGLPRATGDGG